MENVLSNEVLEPDNRPKKSKFKEIRPIKKPKTNGFELNSDFDLVLPVDFGRFIKSYALIFPALSMIGYSYFEAFPRAIYLRRPSNLRERS